MHERNRTRSMDRYGCGLCNRERFISIGDEALFLFLGYFTAMNHLIFVMTAAMRRHIFLVSTEQFVHTRAKFSLILKILLDIVQSFQ